MAHLYFVNIFTILQQAIFFGIESPFIQLVCCDCSAMKRWVRPYGATFVNEWSCCSIKSRRLADCSVHSSNNSSSSSMKRSKTTREQREIQRCDGKAVHVDSVGFTSVPPISLAICPMQRWMHWSTTKSSMVESVQQPWIRWYSLSICHRSTIIEPIRQSNEHQLILAKRAIIS